MVFEQEKQDTPATRQLLINDTHIEPADERKNVVYKNGMPEQIVFHNLYNMEQSVIVTIEPMMVLGRRRSMRDSDITIDLADMNAAEFGVSHYHAMLLAFDNHIYIKDIDSLNGMMLNGKKMQPSREYLIDDRDILALGNLELKVEFV